MWMTEKEKAFLRENLKGSKVRVIHFDPAFDGEKMNIINKDEKKRKDASEKIKKLWKNEEFLKKMKNRRHRSGKKIKIIDIKGDEVIFNSMKELKDTHGIDPYRIRKYLDKNILIKEKDLKENKQLLNCRIESING